MLVLFLLGALGHIMGAAIEPCCLEKNVGGIDYNLREALKNCVEIFYKGGGVFRPDPHLKQA